MSPFLGQVSITDRPILGCRSGESTVHCSHLYEEDEEIGLHGRRLGEPTEYACPLTEPPYPDDLNCMRDARGNAICSNGSHFPPRCPNTPPARYFSPGVTPDVNTGGRIEGQIPPPSSGGSSLLVPIAVGGAGLLALIGYFTLR